MDYIARTCQLRNTLCATNLDALLVTHLPNVRYLCAFTGSAAALLVADRECVLFTDGRYRTQATDELARAGVRNVSVVVSPKSPLIAAAEWLLENRNARLATLGVESHVISAEMRDRLAAFLKGKVRVRPAPALVERARMIKDAAEIQCIRQAVELGASLFEVARKKIRPGATEIEVAAAMEYKARCSGAEAMSFPTILASGTRSALVHGRASEARIPRRGFVVCDFGVILAGYCSDCTRTVYMGRPSREAQDLYQSVLEAQVAAITAVRPGVTAGEVDEAARRVLRRRKLARYFTHSTGHGLGLEIHEAPRIAAGQAQTLEPGMVITIEPGAYVPGKWGVRIEDVVVVTHSGCEVLTPTDKDFRSLE